MFTAHIKSPFGDREEQWDDYRVSQDVRNLAIKFDVFVVGYENDAQQEELGLVRKAYWDVHEEIWRLMSYAGGYDKLLGYCRQALHDVGVGFQAYLAIEKPIAEQEAVAEADYDELATQLIKIAEDNKRLGVDLEAVYDGINVIENDPEQDPELTIYNFVIALYHFTFMFRDTIEALQNLLEGLRMRAAGEEYSPLDYMRDLNGLRSAIGKRQSYEKELTTARNAFKQLPASIPQVPESTASADVSPAAPATSDSPVAPTPPAAPPAS